MKLKYVFYALMALLTNMVQGTDAITGLMKYPCIGSVSVTSTGLVVKFVSGGFIVHQGDVYRRSLEYAEKKEDLVLIPNQETVFYERHTRVFLTPIALQNSVRGFRINNVWDGRSFGEKIPVTNTMYIALSDIPVQIGEDDVENIMVNGEWEPFVKPEIMSQAIVEPQMSVLPVANDINPVVQPSAQTKVTIVSDISPPSSPSSRWLWWLTLPATAGVWLLLHLRTKRK